MAHGVEVVEIRHDATVVVVGREGSTSPSGGVELEAQGGERSLEKLGRGLVLTHLGVGRVQCMYQSAVPWTPFGG